MAILRTKKALMRTMCGAKIIEKRSQELMSLLGLKDTLDRLAKAMVWACFEKSVGFSSGRKESATEYDVEERTNQIRLKREDAIDRAKWRNGVYKLSRSTR